MTKRAALSRRDLDVDFATAVRQRAWVLRMSYALRRRANPHRILAQTANCPLSLVVKLVGMRFRIALIHRT